MATETAKQLPTSVPAPFTAPVDLEALAADRERRQAERDAKRPRLLDCLDPTEARRYEEAKEIFEWKVEFEIFRKAEKDVPAHMEKISKEVVAKNAQDAWARCCDTLGEWPSPKDSRPKITKLGTRKLRDTKG